MDRGLYRLASHTSSEARPDRANGGAGPDGQSDYWMTLQQSIGNRALGRMLNEGWMAAPQAPAVQQAPTSLAGLMGFRSAPAGTIQRLADTPGHSGVPAAPEPEDADTGSQDQAPSQSASQEKGEPAEEATGTPSEPDAGYQPAGGGSSGGGEGGAGQPSDQAGGAAAGEGAAAGGGAAGQGAGEAGEAGEAGGAEGGAQQGEAGAPGEDEEHSATIVTVPEDFQPSDGGSPPILPPAPDGPEIAKPTAQASSGFTAGGRRGSIFFHSMTPAEFDDKHPHAFVPGGRKGTAPWAGGGGAGPKGNQKSGSIQRQVPPSYQAQGNGLFSNADAWVQGGTGTVDVERDYVTSDPGDQGNGWYVTEAAARALQAHEEKHIDTSKSDYSRFIEPMLDRVSRSAATGKGLAYTKRGAIQKLEFYVGWDKALSQFQKEDEQDNGQGGAVDQIDYATGTYPEKFKDKKVRGTQYSFLLKSPMEDFPPENAPNP